MLGAFLNILVLLWLIMLYYRATLADFQFCYKGQAHLLTADSRKSGGASYCPGGILFKNPVHITELQATSKSAFCIKTEICRSKTWKCGRQLQNSTVQILGHIPTDNEYYDFVDSNALLDLDSTTLDCHSEDDGIIPYRFSNELLLSRKARAADAIAHSSQETTEAFPAELTYEPAPKTLVDQTKRMFYFLSHLNPESVKNPLRAVGLLEKTVELVGTICDPNFLNPKFMEEVLRGFLFLLKEQGTERVLDVNEEDFALLTRALDACATNPNPLTLTGETCLSKIHVETVKRMANGKETVIAYMIHEKYSFKWAMYDPVVDAMWFAVNIVHGMCFATFRDNINLHHKYQVAMEELFKNEIRYRWTKPVNLFRNYEYDHIFLGPVNKSLQVLDACTEGAYISSPFLHRLKRPTDLRETREKRSILAEPSIEEMLGQEARCLQTDEERLEAINEIRKEHCPTLI